MGEVLWNLMEVLYKRGYVEYHGSLNANVLKEYNLEVPGLRPAWASLKYYCIVYHIWSVSMLSYHVPGSVNDAHSFHSPPYVSHHKLKYRFQYNNFLIGVWTLGIQKPYIPLVP